MTVHTLHAAGTAMKMSVVLATFALAQAAVDKDLVTSIPGLATPFPSRVWSGYEDPPPFVNSDACVNIALCFAHTLVALQLSFNFAANANKCRA
jgi:hypothetical protein